MRSDTWSDFGGISGRVVNQAISFGTLFTGMAVGLVLLGVAVVLGVAGGGQLAVPAGQLLMALVLARFALNGLHGEFGGWVFSSAGGPWSAVLPVALRYVALTAIWLAPLFLFGRDELAGQMALGMMGGMGAGPAAFLGVGYVLLAMLTPPVFLIVSVSAESFGDVFSAGHWRGLFAGRLADLQIIYVLYLGALALVAVFGMGALAVFMLIDPKIGTVVGACLLAFLLGLAATIMGRLSGFFAFGETADPEPVQAGATAPSGLPAGMPSDGAAAAAHAGLPPGLVADTLTAGRPLLDDAPRIVTAARRRYADAPDEALASLEAVRSSHAPHPMVLHALTLMRVRAGHNDEAVEVGREALDLCIKRAAMPMAGELLRELWPLREELAPSREQVSLVASSLLPDGDLSLAARAFSMLVRDDPQDPKPVKGLMKIAELKLKAQNAPEEALALYTFLLEHCPDSPLAEYFRTGAEQARSRTA